MPVRYKETALLDLKNIVTHYLATTDQDIAIRVYSRIKRELVKLSETPMLDRKEHALGGEGRRWYYILDAKYVAFYERLGPQTIKVSRVWPSKAEPLEPEPPIPAQVTSSPPAPRKPKGFEDVLGEAPTNSVEYRLYQGQGAGILNSEIEARIEYLQNRARRTLSAEYKRHAVAYLQTELGQRRRGE